MERMKNGPWPDRIVHSCLGGSIESSASWLHADHVQADSFVLHFHAVQSLSSLSLIIILASIFLAPTEGKGKGKDKGKAGSKGKSSSLSLGSPAEMAFMVDAAVHNLLFFLSEILSCIYWPVIHMN